MATANKKDNKRKPIIIGAAASEMLTLEPRIMLDAAAVATGAEIAADADLSVQDSSGVQLPEPLAHDEGVQDVAKFDLHEEQSSDDALTPNEPAAVQDTTDYDQGVELVFVDTSIGDYQTLLSGIAEHSVDIHGNERIIEVIEINPDADGILTITTALSEYTNVDAIHILSHADSGIMNIGSSVLNNDNIGFYADQFSQWQNTLSDNADILIYGCNVADGQAGLDFVNELAELTLADVAASVDLTGNADLGGDYNLEYSTGNIETLNPLSDYAMSTWNDVLTAELVVTKVITDGLDGNGELVEGSTIEYTITIENTGDMNATDITLEDFLSGNLTLVNYELQKTYETIGNTQLEVSDVESVFPAVHNTMLLSDNVFGFIEGTSGVTSGVVATTLGGSVEIFADGSFVYTPPTGVTSATDDFMYELTDLFGTTDLMFTAEINITADQIWYVDTSAGVGDGSSASPFNVLDASTVNSNNGVGDVDDPSDYIYLFNTISINDYPTTLAIEDGQTVVGEGSQFIVDNYLLSDAGTSPTIEGIDFLGSGHLAGVTITQDLTGTVADSEITIEDSSFVGTSAASTITFDDVLLDVHLDNMFNITAMDVQVQLLNLHEGSKYIVDGTTVITNMTTDGLVVMNSPNSQFDFGDTQFNQNSVGANSPMILDGNAGSTFNFDSLQILSQSTHGVLINDSGTVNFNAGATYNYTGIIDGADYVIRIVDTVGTLNNVVNSGFVFNDITINTTGTGDGINLENIDGFAVLAGAITTSGRAIATLNTSNLAVSNMPIIANSLGNKTTIELKDPGGTQLFSNVDIVHKSSIATAYPINLIETGAVTFEFIFNNGSSIDNQGTNTFGIVNSSTGTGETVFVDIRDSIFNNAEVQFFGLTTDAHYEGAIQSNIFVNSSIDLLSAAAAGSSRYIFAIQDNMMTGMYGATGAINVGIDTFGVADYRISGNTVTNDNGPAVRIFDSGGTTLRALVENNTNLTGSDVGMLIEKTNSVTVEIDGNDINGGGGTDVNVVNPTTIIELGTNTSTGNGSFTITPFQVGTLVGFVETTYPLDFTPTPLLALNGQEITQQDLAALSQQVLDQMLDVAIDNWMQSGLTGVQMVLLDGVSVSFADLADGLLGIQQGKNIILDIDAANYGWFVDSTPFDNSEFTTTSEGPLVLTGEDAGKYDLLTVLMHEIGHLIGIADTIYDINIPDLMANKLETGTRIYPNGYEIATINLVDENTTTTEVNTLEALGEPDFTMQWDTLRPGDTFTIIVEAELPSPEPDGFFEVSNTAVVTYNDGVNEEPIVVDDTVSAPIAGPAELVVTKEVVEDTLGENGALPGTTVDFLVTIDNIGNDIATNIDIVDLLDDNFTFEGYQLAVPDMYTALGNTLLEVGVPDGPSPSINIAGSVLDNDILTGPLTVTAFDSISSVGGDVVMNADGTFTYMPIAGFNGFDSFSYTVTDGNGVQFQSFVLIQVVGMVWYVDDDGNVNGDGTSEDPFNNFSNIYANVGTDDDNPGDIIYVFSGNYDLTALPDKITLEDNQFFIGEGSDLVVNIGMGDMVIRSAGTAPVISSMDSGIIGFTMDNTLLGVTIGDTGGVALSGDNAGTITIDDVTINSDLKADGAGIINFSNSNLDVTIEDITVTNSGAFLNNDVLVFDTTTGTFTLNGNINISDPVDRGIVLNGINGFDIPNAIINTTNVGIQITSSSNINLSNLTINATVLGDGIVLNDVTNLILNTAVINSVNGGISAANVTTIDLNDITINALVSGDGIVLNNASDLTLSNAMITVADGSALKGTSSDDITVDTATFTSTATDVIVDLDVFGDVIFTDVNLMRSTNVGDMLFISPTTAGTVNFTYNTSGVTPAMVSSTSMASAGFVLLTAAGETLNVSIDNIDFVDTRFFAFVDGTVEGAIQNSTFNSALTLLPAIGFDADAATSRLIFAVQNNTINSDGAGISLVHGNGSESDLRVSLNDIKSMSAEGLIVDDTAAATGGTARLLIEGNTAINGQTGIELNQSGTGNLDAKIFSNDINSSFPAPPNDVEILNPLTDIELGMGLDVNTSSSDSTFTISAFNAAPLVGFVETSFPAGFVPMPLMALGGENTSGIIADSITQADINALWSTAVNNWLAFNLTSEQIALLDNINVEIVDLGSGILGLHDNNTIYIDINAANYGWFVDTTPTDSVEFSVGGDAIGKMDLLTVLMHEIGHVLGQSDAVYNADLPDLMANELSTGTRLLPDVPLQINMDALDEIMQAAIQHWIDSGLTTEQIALINSITYGITDFSNHKLAETTETQITFDLDAGGEGWFVDTTPMDNVEFNMISSDYFVNSEQIDLLTIAMHEIGHVLGYTHDVTNSSLMASFIGAGERYLPDGLDSVESSPHVVSFEAAVTPININGTFPFLGPEQTLTILISASLPDIIPIGVEEVTNQVEVSYFDSVMNQMVLSNLVVVPVDAAPDLTVFKVPDVDVVVTGDGIIYTITIDNVGNQNTDNVMLTETIPEFTVFDPAHSTAGWVDNFDGTFTYDVGLMNVTDPEIVLQFAVTTTAPDVPATEIFNKVLIEDDGVSGPDANLFDNQSVVSNILLFSDTLDSPDIFARPWWDYFDAGRGGPSYPFDHLGAFTQIISLYTMDERVNLVGTHVPENFDPAFGQWNFEQEHMRTVRYDSTPAVQNEFVSDIGQEFRDWTPEGKQIPESQFILRHVDFIADDLKDAINEVNIQEPPVDEVIEASAVNGDSFQSFDHQIQSMSSQFDRSIGAFAAAVKRFNE